MIKRHLALIKAISYFVIVPVILWNLSIGKSVNLWRECKKNEQEISELKLRKNTENTGMVEVAGDGLVLDTIARNKNIDIERYNRYVTATVDDYSLVTDVLVISGGFFKLLEAVNRLENERTVCSLSFQTEMNYKERQKRLKATIVTQEILKEESL